MNFFISELQHKIAECAIKNKLKGLLTELKGFKFVKTLVLELKKVEKDDTTKCNTFYLNSKGETIINENGIDDVFVSIYSTITLIILKIQFINYINI